MQSPFSKIECIFCHYRNAIRQRPQYRLNRLYHGTSSQKRDRAAERAAKERSRGDLDAKHSRIQRSRSVRGAGGVTSPFDVSREAIEEGVILKRLRSRLNAIETAWQRDRSDQSSTIKQFSQFDPDGAKWKDFRELIIDSLASTARNATDSSKLIKRFGLVGDLKKAALNQGGPSGSQDALDRQIYLAFLKFGQKDSDYKFFTTFDLRYPTEWYPNARRLQRDIHLHVGPTNSGKTYTALKRLEESGDGFYAGPLRLLAHEVYSRFNDRGIACELITGDDIRLSTDKHVKMYSSTVEMVDISKMSEVGVIDEIQMMGSEDRGWAWTRALLGAQAKELHLCGETRAVPLIRELVASMGDTLHIHQYDRLNPLKVMSRSLGGNLKKLRKGDCVVSFSIMGIHALKRQIELETGRRAAIVYGSLPPETRARQAALFNDPDNDYDFLVASDAIGMGLNLSIKRIIFETTTKWNGFSRERLSISQLKQIAGRAGRYRTSQDDKSSETRSEPNIKTPGVRYKSTSSIGLVTCLDEVDLPYIHKTMMSEPPPLKSAGLLPTGEVYEDFASTLPPGTPFEYTMQRVNEIASLNPRFSLCETRDAIDVARALDEIPELSIADRLIFCASPVSLRGRVAGQHDVLLALGRAVADRKPVTVVDVQSIRLELLDEPMVADREYLGKLESLHKNLILFMWLSYRFPTVLVDQDMATYAKTLTEDRISTHLSTFSANPVLKKRLEQMQKTSSILREQLAKDMGGSLPTEMHMTLNPDASLEEVERRALLEGEAEGETVREEQYSEGEEVQEHQLDRSNVVRLEQGTEAAEDTGEFGEEPLLPDHDTRNTGETSPAASNDVFQHSSVKNSEIAEQSR